MKKIFKYLAVIAILLITGCATKMDTVIINTLPSSTKIKVFQPSTQYTNDVLEITVKVQNPTQNEYNNILYRFKWFDQANYEVGQNLSIWKPLFLEARDTKKLTDLAPTPKAEQYKFYIKQQKGNSLIKRIDPKSMLSMDICYGSEELHLFTQKMVSGMLQSEIFDGTPVINIRKIEDSTDENIDTKPIADSIKTAIIKSKRARFIDTSLRATINSELDYQNSSKYINKNSSSKIGKQVAPNYILDGSIISIKKKLDNFYKITLQLHNLETAIVDWAEEKEVRKVGKQDE